MATASGTYSTAFTLNSKYNSLATYTANMSISIPTGATVTAATISVTVSQDPSKGSYFYVGSTTWQSGLRFTTAKGTKSGDYTDYVGAGISSLSIPINFKSTSDSVASSQLTISSITLTVTYTEGAATITSVSSGTIGGTCTLAMDVKNASYKEQVKVIIGSTYYTCVDLTSYSKGSRTVSVPLAAAMANSLPSAASTTATLRVLTYAADGTTLIGKNNKTFTLTVPNNSTFQPTATISGSKIQGTVSAQTNYIQGLDGVTLTGSGTAKYSASITRVQITGDADNPAYSASGSSGSVTVKPLNTSGSHTYTCTVTDSRGLTGTATLTLSVDSYTRLTLSASAYRSSGTAASATGTYLGTQVTLNSSATITIQYKSGTGTYVTAYSGSGSSYSSFDTGSKGAILGATSQFTVLISANDGKVSLSSEHAIGTSAVYLYMDAQNNQIGIGAYPSANNQMRVGFNQVVDGSVTATSFNGTIGTATKGATNNPIYLNAGTPTACQYPASGAWFRGIPQVGSDGVMEIGRYIDFHPTSASTIDYGIRLDSGTSTTGRTYTFGTSGGELVVHAAGTAQGGASLPVYVNASGVVTACGNTMFRKVAATASYSSLAAGGATNVSPSPTLSGYTVAAVLRILTGNNNVVVRSFNGSTVWLYNVGSSAASGTVEMTVLMVNSSLIS